MPTERTRTLVDSFVESTKESLRYFAGGRLSDEEIDFLAEYTVNRLDFNNEWQMHKGIGYFARQAAEDWLQKKDLAMTQVKGAELS